MTIFSGLANVLQGNSAARAANAQARATTDATTRALDFQEEGRDLSFDFLQPFYDTGQEGLAAYSGAVLGGEFAPDLTENGLGGALESMGINRAGMDFRLNEGMSALGNQFSAMGGLDGNQAKALERFRMGTVTDEYDRGLARLQGLAGQGQVAAGGLAGAATGAGSGLGQTAFAGGTAAGAQSASALLNNPGANFLRAGGAGAQTLAGFFA